LLHLRQDAEEILHVMPDLVGDHIGLRELASLAVVTAAEPALQVAEEGSVEINPLVVRTIERPHGRAREAAGRTGRAGKHHERGGAVAAALLLKDIPPNHLGAAEHGGDELAGAVARRARLGRRAIGRVIGVAAAAQNLGAADQEPGIDAERPADEAEHHEGADPHAAGADREPEAPAAVAALLAAAIFYVLTLRQSIPWLRWLPSLHRFPPGCSGREPRNPGTQSPDFARASRALHPGHGIPVHPYRFRARRRHPVRRLSSSLP